MTNVRFGKRTRERLAKRTRDPNISYLADRANNRVTETSGGYAET